MDGKQALEALERALNKCDSSLMTPADLQWVIRAALKEAGPAAVPETREPLDIPAEFVPAAKVEWERLRAWEAWGREHAVPALEDCGGNDCQAYTKWLSDKPKLCGCYSCRARGVLAAAPKDRP